MIVWKRPPATRRYGQAKRAWEANEPCRKGCGRHPDGLTFGSWKVHESKCRGYAQQSHANR